MPTSGSDLIDVMKPVFAPAAPADREWLVEQKFDGIRAVVTTTPHAKLTSRTGHDLTAKFPELAKAVAERESKGEWVLDGEIVATTGKFSDLQRRTGFGRRGESGDAEAADVELVLFDVLVADGEDVREQTIEKRRKLLEKWAGKKPPARIRVAGRDLLDGTQIDRRFKRSRREGAEGLVLKRPGSRYLAGKQESWLKLKVTGQQEFVIAGWLPGKGARKALPGALLLGYHEDFSGVLRYAGRVGSGFKQADLEYFRSRFEKSARKTSPFDSRDKDALPSEARFVTPRLVAEVKFTEWTPDNRLRQPVYLGLRDDVNPATVRRERAGRYPNGGADGINRIAGHDVKLSNLEKAMFPKGGVSKGGMVGYYRTIAPVLLPHLAGRAVTRRRFPDGPAGTSFWEKNCPPSRPEWVPTYEVEGSTGTVNFCGIDTEAALAWAANSGAIELHTPMSLASDPDVAETVVFDLDPGKPAGMREACTVALVLRQTLELVGLQSFAKTSGSKGLQLYVPLNRGEAGFEDTKKFARDLAEMMADRLPELVVSNMKKSLRRGKVLIDWSQNSRHKTTVCVYSMRANDPPGISTPVDWREVEAARRSSAGPDPLRFGPDDVADRVDRLGDLFTPVLELKQRLP